MLQVNTEVRDDVVYMQVNYASPGSSTFQAEIGFDPVTARKLADYLVAGARELEQAKQQEPEAVAT